MDINTLKSYPHKQRQALSALLKSRKSYAQYLCRRQGGNKKSVPFIVRLRSCLASEQSSSEGLLATFFVLPSLRRTSRGGLTTGKWRVR
ncbi:hypothetical protein C7Y71_009790 [Pseudoprevotella muciniphila]|uniref:Uncharacterized protein n=1 Tax=Pseudoprevotella muciniphila TaxID=2133944 RepID=A0A5P8E8I0_9BACT|nr:hypothetical protein C7Y71_009790 [Pseudoprevotella muciniphila]